MTVQTAGGTAGEAGPLNPLCARTLSLGVQGRTHRASLSLGSIEQFTTHKTLLTVKPSVLSHVTRCDKG